MAKLSVGFPLTRLAIATGEALLTAGTDGKGGVNFLRLVPGCQLERWSCSSGIFTTVSSMEGNLAHQGNS